MSRRTLLCLLSLLVLAACRDGLVNPDGPGSDSVLTATADVRIVASSVAPIPGERVTMAIELDQDRGGAPLVGIEGDLSWRAGSLAYVGQVLESGTLAPVGLESSGDRLRFLSTRPLGLTVRPLTLVFEVREAEGLGTLALELRHAVDADGQEVVLSTPSSEPVPVTGLPTSANAESPTWREWATVLDPDFKVTAGPARVPGEGFIYGDPTLDASVNVLDASYMGNLAVGSGEIIIGTDAPSRDAVLAGNVRPANLPGLGEATDPCPPGIDVCGGTSRSINVLDVAAIAREAVGFAEDIVGELVPRSAQVMGATLSGTITGSVSLQADSVYLVSGTVRVAAGGTLVVPAGTRIEAQKGAAIVVERGGRMEVSGSLADPVVFTCEAGSQNRGCWRGITVLGHAPINIGTMTSPAAPGNGQSGCLEAQLDPRDGLFGGCDPNDDSGLFRYARVEFATLGLSLRGVGSATEIEGIQVHGGLANGIAIAGGTVDLSRVLVTATGGTALRWQDGWTGRAQSLLLQLDPSSDVTAIYGTNQSTSGSSTLFSRPTIYNATVVSLNPGATSQPAVRLEGGTGAELRNLLVLGAPVGLDVDDAATCSRYPSDLIIANSALAGVGANGDGDADMGCAGDPTFEEDLLNDGSFANTFITNGSEVASLLKDGLSAFLPDFRFDPTGVGPTLIGATPPSDGFFDTGLTFIGGAPVGAVPIPNIPWYSGWTRGGIETSLSFGMITGTVTSPSLGALEGVTVIADMGDVAALTDATGAFGIPFVMPGAANLTVAGLPGQCTDPGTTATTVTAGQTTIQDIAITCTAPYSWRNDWVPDSIGAGDIVALDLFTNPGVTNLGGVQVELFYEATLLTVDSVVAAGGPLDLTAVNTGSPGMINLLATSITPLAGEQYIARAYFSSALGAGGSVVTSTPSASLVVSDFGGNQIPNGAIIEDTLAVTGSTADVSVAKAGPGAGTVGDTVTFIITTTNNGSDAAQDVVVTDTLSADLAFVDATRSGVEAGGIVAWPTVASLAPGGSVTDTLRAQLLRSGTATNVAAAVSATADPDPNNNTDTASVAVAAAVAQLIWEVEYGDDSVATPVVIGGTTVAIAGNDSASIGRVPENFTVEHGIRGLHAGYWRSDLNAGPATSTSEVTFTLAFSRAVEDLTFDLLDVDTDSIFHDSITVVAWGSSGSFAPVAMLGGTGVVEVAPGIYSGRFEVGPDSATSNVSLTFPQPVDSVTFTYGPGPLSGFNPGQQAIGLSDLNWTITDISQSGQLPSSMLQAINRHAQEVRNGLPLRRSLPIKVDR